jgi:hypothetical protein
VQEENLMAVGNEHGDRAKHYHDPLIHDNLFKEREGHGVNIPLLTEVEQREWLRMETERDRPGVRSD